MRYYDYLMPSVNFFGPGCLEVIGERAKILNGKKALIVTDKFLSSLKGGAVERSIEYLAKAGIEAVIFDQVEPNPKDVNVYAGAKVYKENNCDMIITIGGGSPHDCGKGIGIAVTHPKDICEYAGIETLEFPLPPIIAVNTTAGTASEVTRHCGKGIGIAVTHPKDICEYAGIETLEFPLPPIIAVNTTAGTASEVTRHAVITNTKTKVKFVIVSWRNLPQVSINDPILMIGKPSKLTAATGMDALTHAVEAYVSKDANPVTDAAAIQAIKLIATNLRQAVANGENLKARENMAYASLLAGMAFNNGNLGYVHAMAHQLGGLYDMPHGVANAMFSCYPSYQTYSYKS